MSRCRTTIKLLREAQYSALAPMRKSMDKTKPVLTRQAIRRIDQAAGSTVDNFALGWQVEFSWTEKSINNPYKTVSTSYVAAPISATASRKTLPEATWQLLRMEHWPQR